jgi:long-subunit fatty acid transport protein
MWLLIAFLVLAHPGFVSAQEELAPPDVTATPLPVGSGARALGQSAFIAVADDATAASWNPAGLIQLERPEVSVVGSWILGVQDFSSHSPRIDIGREEWSNAELNFASVAYPFRVAEKNFVVSLNYHEVYDFGLDLSFDQTVRGSTSNLPLEIDVESDGAVSSTSLAGSTSVTPDLAVGAGLNLYRDKFLGDDTWKVETSGAGTGTLAGKMSTFRFHNTETFENFRAWNATLGLLWDAWSAGERKLTLGLVYQTPFTATVDRETEAHSALDGMTFESRAEEEFDMDIPQSAGAGFNYRFSDSFSVSGDVQWTDWSDFLQDSESGTRSSPIGGGPVEHIDDTVAVRVGTEKLFSGQKAIYALRGGAFYEPRPVLGEPMDVFGVSLGTGLTTNWYSLDFAYQFRFGEDVSGRNLGLDRSLDYNVQEHRLIGSLVIYF